MKDGAFFLIPSFLLFHFRMAGAGDGKLAAVTGGFLGIRGGIAVVMFGLAVGAVWSVFRMWKDRSFQTRMNYLFQYLVNMLYRGDYRKYDELSGIEARHRIPLAACLSVGGYFYLIGTAAAVLGGWKL